MTIAKNYADFCRELEKRRAEWPPKLIEKAEFAKRALWTIENNKPEMKEAHRERTPSAYTEMIGRITDFAEAYGAWKASKGSG